MARAGTIGRILSLGHPMPGPRVDNYNFCSAPSFFDYDALVVDVGALDALIEGVMDSTVEARTFTDARVVAETPAPAEVALRDILKRRHDETAALLASGGVLIVFAHAPARHRIGATEYASYDWLPAAVGGALVPAEGSVVEVVDAAHPLASFVRGQLANIAYRARVELGVVSDYAEGGGRVLAQSRGGAAVGVELPSDAGRIVLLPALAKPPSGDARYAASDALQRGIRRMLGSVAEGVEPRWLSAHPVPGLAERAASMDGARRAAEAAASALSEAEAARDELARFQQLLWQEGAIGLDEVVVSALRRIGFDVYDGNLEALELRAEGASVLLEIEASTEAVDLAPHHRLRQRIEQAIERRGAAPRGLIFVNGLRLESPASRGEPVSPALRTAAETMRYCLSTTTSLFEAVVAQLAGDDAAVATYRSRLVSTDGLLA